MTSNVLRACGNRVALEEEANALREVIEKEKSTSESFKCQVEEQKTVMEGEQLKAAAFSNSMEGIISLQQATEQLLQSIEHVQTTFKSILPSLQHEAVACRIPVTDQFMVKWRNVLEYLSTAPDMLEERLGDIVERRRANQVHKLVHESLRDHAAQAVDRMGVIIREMNRSIDDKRLGVLHPIRRVSNEIYKEIFEYAVDEEQAELMDKIDRKIPPYEHLPCVALHISATCRHWREIATRTPTLWRHIVAPWRHHYDHKTIGRTRFLHCLSLAGERGLELTLRGNELGRWEHIFEEECTRQWYHITIIDTNDIPSELPTSSRLSIYSSDHALKMVKLPSHLISSTMVMSCSKVFPKFASPAPKLTTLVIYFPNHKHIYPDIGLLLSSLPSLSHLTLKCNLDYSSNFAETHTAPVNNTLKTLSIMSQFLEVFEIWSISTPSFTVLEILDLHDDFTETSESLLSEAGAPIKDTVTDLHISSSEEISMKTGILSLIRCFSMLKRLELHGFAVTPGLEALWESSKEPSLMQIVIKDYPEGKEKLREVIEAAGPIASSWKISY